MPRHSERNPSQHDRIRELAAKGLPPATIAARLGVSHPTVMRALNPERVLQHREAVKRSAERNKEGDE